MATLTMPQLGESVTEGTILRWLKQSGDDVALDEPIVEVETEKVTVEIPSAYAGRLETILVAEGETVAVGTPLAEIAEATGAPQQTPAAGGGAAHTAAAPPPPEPSRARESDPPAADAGASVGRTPGTYQRRRYSPAVERLAAERGIDPASVAGSGAGGRVRRQDIQAAAERIAAVPTEAAAPSGSRPPRDRGVVVALSPTRRHIGQRMLESVRNAPHAWLLMEADVSNLVRLRTAQRREFREREGAELTYLPFAAKAVCRALHAVPTVNATWRGDDLIRHTGVHLGLAVDAAEGLIVPVLKDADQLSIAALAVRLADLAERARARRLRLDEVEGGTFTLDNTGALGSLMSAPIINPPQVAILTTEAITKRPVVVGGDAIAMRSMMNLCLSFDHRAMDGGEAAAFVGAVKAALEAFKPDTSIY